MLTLTHILYGLAVLAVAAIVVLASPTRKCPRWACPGVASTRMCTAHLSGVSDYPEHSGKDRP